MSELIPIRFFKWRDNDNRRTEGRGDREPPHWVLEGAELSMRARAIGLQLSKLVNTFFTTLDQRRVVPLIVAASMDNLRTSKSNRKEIADLFAYRNADALIGLQGNSSLMVKVSSREHAQKIQERLDAAEDNARAISCISQIGEFKPNVSISDTLEGRYKLKLIDFQDVTCNKAVAALVNRSLEPFHGQLRPYSNRLKIYSVDGAHVKAVVDSLRAAGVLYSCLPMPVYSAVLDNLGMEADVVPVLVRDPEREYPALGVLDSGIAECAPMKPWITGRSDPIYPEEYIDRCHGTAVAGTAIYGDRLAGAEWTGVHEGVTIFDGTVMPGNGETIYEDDLISNIKEVLEVHHAKAKVWNLSLSIDREISDASVSDFAIALDDLQREHNLLICKSAGNTTCFMNGDECRPLSVGADSCLALVVGSVAHVKAPHDLVPVGACSPFSRVGPGPEASVKPEIAHYGGNAGRRKDGKMSVSGVPTVSVSGNLIRMVGTSFSVPRVSAMAAKLAQELGDAADPLVLKTLLIHSAKYAEGIKTDDVMTMRGQGFGIPSAVTRVLHDSPDEATIILRDEMVRGNWVEILGFPMPTELSTDGFFDAQVVVTLVSNPLLDASQGAEYCQSDIDVKLGSYANEKERDTERRSFLNPVGRDGAQNFLKSDIYSVRARKQNVGFGRERTLIERDLKYCPVKKYSVDLREATEKNRNLYLGVDRKWYLELKGIYRQHAEHVAAERGDVLKQDFCLAVTIRDPKKRGIANSAVAALLRSRAFDNIPVRLHSEARVAYRG